MEAEMPGELPVHTLRQTEGGKRCNTVREVRSDMSGLQHGVLSEKEAGMTDSEVYEAVFSAFNITNTRTLNERVVHLAFSVHSLLEC